MLCMHILSQSSEFHEIYGKQQPLNLCFHENIFDSLELPPGTQIILLYDVPSGARSLKAVPAKLQVAGQHPNTGKIVDKDTK